MIYLDNASTSWPKPAAVWEEMKKHLEESAANPGRGGHRMSLQAGRLVYEAREELAKLFNISNPLRVIFTLNATEALNLALFGILKTGDHVITTGIEHNSVIRPLAALKEEGIQTTVIPCSPTGDVNSADIEGAIKENTRLIVLTHASNVMGTIMPISKIGALARQKNVKLLVDAAQTAGVLPIDIREMQIDLMAFSGHKGLLGPQGTGGLFINEGIDLKPLKYGGTGSLSEQEIQPSDLPDRYESGTPNTIGLVGLAAGVRHLGKVGVEKIREHEQQLTSRFLKGLRGIKGVKIYGSGDAGRQVGVVSINIGNIDSGQVGFMLDRTFNIATRTGLHCSPSAHRTIGTLEQGTVRFGFSYATTIEEIEAALAALARIAEEMG